MAITIDLPPDLEAVLRHDLENLDASAKEAVLVDLFRRHVVTQAQLARALGISRLQSDAVLKRHQVYYDFTAEEIAAESGALEKLRNDHAHRR